AGVQTENDAYAKTLDEQEEASLLLELFETVLRDRAAAFHGRPHQFFPINAQRELIEKYILKRSDIIETFKIKTSFTEVTSNLDCGSRIEDTIMAEIRECQREFACVRDLYNGRIEFYKQLQNLSDQVGDLKLPFSVDRETRAGVLKNKNLALEQELSAISSRLRYLKNVEHDDLTAGQSRNGTQSNICIICQDEYNLGLLGTCGHIFCHDCFQKWLSVHNSCPICKSKMKKEDLMIFKPKAENNPGNGVKTESKTETPTALDANIKHEPRATSNIDDTESVSGSRSGSVLEETLERKPESKPEKEIFSMVSDKYYNQLLDVKILKMYGIKIDMIIK
ncbi:hypothetical protein FF38_00472, partial [Lucilia cuprina]